MDCSWLGTAIVDGDQHQYILGTGFGVLDKDIKITIIIEDTCIQELELRLVLTSLPAFLNQLVVRKGPLRIFIEHLQIRMGWGSIEVIIKLLYILSMVALAVRKAKKPLFQYRIAAIPKR